MNRDGAPALGLGLLTALGLLACSETPDREPKPVSKPPSVEAKGPRPVREGMTCSPEIVGPDDDVTFLFPTDKGSYFVIEPPGDLYFFITFPSPSPDDLLPIAPETFARLEQFTTKVRDIRGLRGMEGPPRPIFDKEGRYRVVVGKELETEPENEWTTGLCTLHYTPHP